MGSVPSPGLASKRPPLALGHILNTHAYIGVAERDDDAVTLRLSES